MPKLKADKVSIDRAYIRRNIIIHTSVATKEIEAKSTKVNSIECVDCDSDRLQSLVLDGAVAQIILVPKGVKCNHRPYWLVQA